MGCIETHVQCIETHARTTIVSIYIRYRSKWSLAAQLKKNQQSVFTDYSNMPAVAEHTVNPGHKVD